MKMRFFILLIFSLCLCLASCNFATAQNINSIRAKCPVAIGGYSSITLLSGGDINAIPCATKNFLVNGSPISGGTFSGGTTANFIPYSTGVDTLANSPLSWNGTIYTFNNTALNSQYKMDFTPNAGTGSFNVGDYTTTPTYYFTTTFAGNSELASGEIALGDITAQSSGLRFDISNIGNSFAFTNTAATYSLNFDLDTGLFNLDGDYQYNGTTIITNQFGFPLFGTDAQFYIGGNNSTPIFQGRNSMVVNTATYTPLILRGAAAQSANLFELQNSASSVLTNFTSNGGWQPASMADGSAANNTVYYSTTASKLVYKDAGGVVNALY